MGTSFTEASRLDNSRVKGKLPSQTDEIMGPNDTISSMPSQADETMQLNDKTLGRLLKSFTGG